MSIAFHITYLVSIFALAAYLGADSSRLFSKNTFDHDHTFYYVETKRGVTVPKVSIVWCVAQSAYMLVFFTSGALAWLIQQGIVEALRSLLAIEVKPPFDMSDYLASWIYGAITWSGYFAGKAALYEFTSIEVMRHINSRDPMQHPNLDLTFRKVFESSHERSQLL